MANNYCDQIISADIISDCNNFIIPGAENEAVIINRNDIDFDNIKYSATERNVVTALPIKTGKRGYTVKVPGKVPYTGTNSAMAEADILNTFSHTVNFVVLNHDPQIASEILDGLATGSFVFIMENKFKNTNKATNPGNNVFQIYGLQTGLHATEINRDLYAEDANGGWTVSMTETGSSQSATFLYTNSLVSTRILFESLVIATEPTITVTPTTLSYTSASSSKPVSVVSNTGWVAIVTSGGQFISTSDTQGGSGTSTSTIWVAANTTAAARTGTIRFMSVNDATIYKDVTISQSA